jgi:phosphate transport system substrate-binding protein
MAIMRKLFYVSALLVLPLSLSAATVTIKGSDTMVRLAQRWAEEYMKKNPAEVIQVSGGGSGTGIAAILNSGTDICQASREMDKKELALAEKRRIAIRQIPVALDGIAVYVNKANPVKELTLMQLRGIYTGRISNWRDVGGEDRRIVLYSRENNSGTYAFFRRLVLAGDDYSPAAQTLPGTASVVNAVIHDKYGIGYGGIAWETNVNHLAIKQSDSSTAVAPTRNAITGGNYPIARRLYWIFNGEPTGPERALLNWVLSPEGQAIAGKVDYVPLARDEAEKNVVK